MAGLLTFFPGFYLPFITIIDTFTPFMFLGGLFFISVWRANKLSRQDKKSTFWFLATGIVSGLMSLTRSDGLLWLAGGMISILLVRRAHKKTWKSVIGDYCLILLGFFIVMMP
ncbi:hypothetical protein EG832_14840, partial [bacterium]|nr:hypothetical protein [bacterium]